LNVFGASQVQKNCGDDRGLSSDRPSYRKRCWCFALMRRKAQQPLKMNPVGLAELTGFFIAIESKDASVSSAKGYIWGINQTSPLWRLVNCQVVHISKSVYFS
jgi:hypothetical protein